MKRYQDTPGPLILTHRGGAGEAPENTRAAFRHALDVDLTHLETDVRIAAGGTLYLVHNATSLLPDRPLIVRYAIFKVESSRAEN
jgi:glycerophosphoryl diester phosphodiesterase